MAQCVKAKFASELSANMRISEIALQNTRFRRPNRAYQCENCGSWHLTSVSKKKFTNRQEWIAQKTKEWTEKHGLNKE